MQECGVIAAKSKTIEPMEIPEGGEGEGGGGHREKGKIEKNYTLYTSPDASIIQILHVMWVRKRIYNVKCTYMYVCRQIKPLQRVMILT